MQKKQIRKKRKNGSLNYMCYLMMNMPLGGTFVHHEPYSFTPHIYAKKIGIKVMVRRQPDGSTKVWRIE